ncbi:uncharacterized protein Bfra_007664 [Botrytis fragariae]|uniref:Uncharacterized protein n=1 Tax=Botrytis fragariae TaxID=1964551 RepID=A0A8H6APU4_9HELO|nr:uncharacterized protein Bfra_007664 [Botrytis fragariae]KAF5871150.1 hypothetical protein Bfra_007664 [Botrytis fragariae]
MQISNTSFNAMTSHALLNPPKVSRLFGRVLKLIDNPPEDLFLRNRNVGKVRVDCKLQLSRSKWGVLGHAENTAGIIYMSLGFHQPGDCRLFQATVSVTSKENKDGNRKDESLSSSSHITNRFSPKQLLGEERKVSVKKTVHFTLLHNYPNQKGHKTSVYRTLKWDLIESDFEIQATHSDVIRTAFAFEHAGDAFYMEVNIEGKLKSPKDRIRRHLKFSSRAKGSKVTTLLGNEDRKFGSCTDRSATCCAPIRSTGWDRGKNAPGPSINRAIINPVEQSRATIGSPTLIRGVSNFSLGDPAHPAIENFTKALSIFVDRRQQNAQKSIMKPEKSTLRPVEEVVELESELRTDVESSYSSSDAKLVNEEDLELNHENLAIIKKRAD